MKSLKTTFLIIAILAATGMVSMAFANDGWDGDRYGGYMGYGAGSGGFMTDPGMMGFGYGMGPAMMGYAPGYGRFGWRDDTAGLSREDSSRLKEAHDIFFDETHVLRNDIRDKQFDLNHELDKANPDKTKVAELQKTLSRLQADYDQKVLAYRLEVRKLLPQNLVPRSYGYGPGYWGCNR